MTSARRGLLWFVVFALFAAQALGLMHRVVHLPHGIGAPAHAGPVLQDHSHGHGHGQSDSNWVADLFHGHSDDSSCRLFDPLNHDAAPLVSAVVLPALLAARFIDVFQGEFLARWAALYDARGPPSSR